MFKFHAMLKIQGALAVGSSDFHEKAVKGEFMFTLVFYAE
jgi:hypothetical protein